MLQKACLLCGAQEGGCAHPDPAGFYRFGPYRLWRRVWQGNHSEVWAASQGEDTTRVALKLFADYSASQDRPYEEWLLATLSEVAPFWSSGVQPQLPRLLHQGKEENRVYLVSQWIEGESLDTRLSTQPDGLAPVRVASWIARALSALSWLHNASLPGETGKRCCLHARLASHSLLLGEDGEVYLVGLGAYEHGEKHPKRRETRTGPGPYLEPYQYYAPERFKDQPIDHRADLYSMGVILYRALTGVYPFEDSMFAAYMVGVLSKEPPLPSQHRPDIPVALDKIVQKAISKDPENRCQSAQEMQQALLSFLEEASPPHRPSADTMPTRRWWEFWK